jgi:magnesium transporter
MITCRVVRDGVLANPVREVVDLLHESAGVVTSALESQLAQVSNRLNVVMKHLTAWAGIILVPTLIPGIYGMNFHSMPELSWAVGYPLALGLMLASAGALYLAFKRRDWL